MNTTIQKWGNSQGLRLVQQLLKEANVKVGDTVSVSVERGVITIRKPKRTKVDLEALLKKMPADYKPSEYDWGKPTGKEV